MVKNTKMGKIKGGSIIDKIATSIANEGSLIFIGVIFEILNFASLLSLLINSHNNKFNIVFSLFIFFICLSFFTLMYQSGICYKMLGTNNWLYTIAAVLLGICALAQFISSTLMVTVLNVNKDNVKNNIFNPTEKYRLLFRNYEISYIINNLFIFISSLLIIYNNKESSDNVLESDKTINDDMLGGGTININNEYLLIGTTTGAVVTAAIMLYYGSTVYHNVITKKRQLIQGTTNSKATLPAIGKSMTKAQPPTTSAPTTKPIKPKYTIKRPLKEECD